MLTYGQADYVGGSRQAKSVDSDIVGGLLDIGERVVLEDIWLENFPR